MDYISAIAERKNQGDLDWVIVRENSEGEYAGQGGRSHTGFDWEVGTGNRYRLAPWHILNIASQN